MGRDVTVRARRIKVPAYRIDNHQWRLLKRKHKAYSKSHNLPCWLHAYGMCVFNGAPIDYGAPPQSPHAYETDHRSPRDTHPHLMYVWANLAPSHCKCNRTRQAKPVGEQHVWVRPAF